jgi:hypothetical protein
MLKKGSNFVSAVFLIPPLVFVIYSVYHQDFSSTFFVMWLLFCFMGLQNFLLGLSNIILPLETADVFKWKSNQFQREYSYVNFATAIPGILSYWYHGNFHLAATILYLPATLFITPLLIKEIRKGKRKNGKLLYLFLQNLIVSGALIVLLLRLSKA